MNIFNLLFPRTYDFFKDSLIYDVDTTCLLESLFFTMTVLFPIVIIHVLWDIINILIGILKIHT